jgi:hypothetical protein
MTSEGSPMKDGFKTRVSALGSSFGWLAFTLLIATGCRSNSRSDLIEAELRTKDRQLRELQAELDRSRILNQVFEQEYVVPSTPGAARSEGSGPIIRKLELGTGTGTADEDRLPGEEILILIVAPKDEDGHPTKAVGSLSVQVQEITPEGTKVPLHTWDISPTQLRPLWSQGLFSTGYHVKLGMRELPRHEKLRITAQFTSLDGRVLETDKDVRTRPVVVSSPSIPVLPAPQGPILTKKAAILLPPVKPSRAE